jgi:hypothetical protein
MIEKSKEEQIELNVLRKEFNFKYFTLQIWTDKHWNNALIVKTQEYIAQIVIRYNKHFITLFNEIDLKKRNGVTCKMSFISEYFMSRDKTKEFSIRESSDIIFLNITEENHDPTKKILAQGKGREETVLARMPLPIDIFQK